jgi:hypothetical protein
MSEATTVDAVAVTSEGDDGNSPANPNISCDRCGTLTTWNPYCPSCGAYLEFSGTPAWHPDEQLSTIPTALAAPTTAPTTAPETDPENTTATTADSTVAAAPGDGSAPADASAKGASDADPHRDFGVRHLITGLFHHGEHEAKAAETELEHEAKAAETELEHERDAREKHLEHEIAKAKADIKGDLHPSEHEVKPWWASWGETPSVPEEIDPAPAAKVMASSGIVPDAESNEGVVFESRRVVPAPPIFAPEAELPGFPLDDTAKTRAIGSEGLDANGETCTRCDLTNPAGRQYCDWCGTPLPGVLLGPESDSYNPYGVKSSGTVEVSSAPRRSYVLKIIVLVLVLLTLVWAVWFFFFGPKAEESRTAVKVVIQQFTEWLAPSIGDEATITTVTASSSLTGTSPLALKSVSSRDFWASESMTLYGAGSSVVFTLDTKYEIDRVAIYPGIQNQTFDVNALGTPETVSIDAGDGKITQAHVKYVEASGDYEQIIQIPVVITDKVTITFDQVYPPRYPNSSGNTIGEVSVSAVAFLQVPSATTVNPLSTASASPSASGSASPSGSPSSSGSSSASASPSPSTTSTKNSKSSPSPSPSPSSN